MRHVSSQQDSQFPTLHGASNEDSHRPTRRPHRLGHHRQRPDHDRIRGGAVPDEQGRNRREDTGRRSHPPHQTGLGHRRVGVENRWLGRGLCRRQQVANIMGLTYRTSRRRRSRQTVASCRYLVDGQREILSVSHPRGGRVRLVAQGGSHRSGHQARPWRKREGGHPVPTLRWDGSLHGIVLR